MSCIFCDLGALFMFSIINKVSSSPSKLDPPDLHVLYIISINWLQRRGLSMTGIKFLNSEDYKKALISWNHATFQHP